MKITNKGLGYVDALYTARMSSYLQIIWESLLWNGGRFATVETEERRATGY